MKPLWFQITIFVLTLLTVKIHGQSPVEDFEQGRPIAAGAGVSFMDMKISEVVRYLKIDPGLLASAASQGETGILEKFKSFVQDKMLSMVSVPCYADLAYFAQQLFEYGKYVNRLTTTCNGAGGINCTCAKAVEDLVDERSWTMSGKLPK